MSYKGIDPELWGPIVWRMIHRVSTIYDKNKYILTIPISVFVNILIYFLILLPCKFCRDELDKTLSSHPDLNIRRLKKEQDIKLFSYKLHRNVSTRLKKPHIYTYDEIEEKSFANDTFDTEFYNDMCQFEVFLHRNGRPIHHIYYKLLMSLLILSPNSHILKRLETELTTRGLCSRESQT